MATCWAVEHYGSGHHVFDDDDWLFAVQTDQSGLGNVSSQPVALSGGQA
jgi:hypothetical protein